MAINDRKLVATVELTTHFADFAFWNLLTAEATFPVGLLHFATSVAVEKAIVAGTVLIPEDEDSVFSVARDTVIAPELIRQVENLPHPYSVADI